MRCWYFYPRSPRGERLTKQPVGICQRHISIHAPREGSDFGGFTVFPSPTNFYPRSPRGERPGLLLLPGTCFPDFYPRSPRGERHDSDSLPTLLGNHFYPRSPRGERRCRPGRQLRGCAISIHAPREGSDQTCAAALAVGDLISIHAPREGSDYIACMVAVFADDFYPRSPRGERPPAEGR